MLMSIEGVYRNGKIELAQSPAEELDDTPVIVTFLTAGQIDLREHGIDAAQAAEIRARLAAFAEDWESPEMAVYDDYDAAKAARLARRCRPRPLPTCRPTDGQDTSGSRRTGR